MCGKTFGAHPDALLLLQRREMQVRTATFIADCMLADDKPMRPVKAPGVAPKRKLPNEICCAMCNTLKPRKTAFPRASMVCHECQPKARAETRRRYWDKFKAEGRRKPATKVCTSCGFDQPRNVFRRYVRENGVNREYQSDLCRSCETRHDRK